MKLLLLIALILLTSCSTLQKQKGYENYQKKYLLDTKINTMITGMKYFSDRLDLIFDQGMPTKAQILDAFNKGSKMDYNQAIDNAAENAETECTSTCIRVNKQSILKLKK